MVQTRNYVRDPANYDQLQLDTNVGVKAHLAPHFGMTWRPVDPVRVAMTMHTEQKFEIDAGLTAALPSGTESGTTRSQVHDFVPWQFGLGGTLDVLRTTPNKLSVAGTLTYALWSRYLDRHGDSPGEYGTNFLWKDTLTPTVGVRHSVGNFRDYLDVTYVPSPVPEQIGRSNYVDNDRVGVVIGGDYTVPVGGVHLRPGVMLQGQRLIRRYQHKNDELIQDEVPDDAVDASGKPLAGAKGLQTNNPGWPGFASEGWVYGGAVTIAVVY